MINIQINDRELQTVISTLTKRMTHTDQLMSIIAKSLESQTQQAFEDEGQHGQKWKNLSETTITQRLKGRKGQPSWPGKILNRSGGIGLLGSLMSRYTANTAIVGAGSGKSGKYAIIQQFGGYAGRGKKVFIPARPYFPITPDGKLTKHCEQTICDVLLRFLM